MKAYVLPFKVCLVLTKSKGKTMKKQLHFVLASLIAFCASPTFAQTQVEEAMPSNVVEQVSHSQTEAKSQDVNLVNLNTATAAEIQDKLVGIGAKKAQAIVEYREKHGKFISIEQVTEVSGIGKATLDKNRDRIVLE